MKLHKYSRGQLVPLTKLLITRNMNPKLMESLPDIGYTVYKDLDLVAAGFMRWIEGGYGMMDSFITNPEFSSKERYEALNLISDALMAKAKEMEFSKVILLTNETSIMLRSQNYEFTILDQVIAIKEL